MFDNVPDWLTEKVKGLRDTVDPAERGQVYYEASGWTIAYYLRKDVRAEDAEEFFDPPGGEPADEHDSLWHAHVNRVILIAETLFLLRSSPAFAELRKRLEKRALRPSFFEMLAAKQFLKAGFEIDARHPTGVRGQDFDFVATRDNKALNVEVTALKANEFSETTILNALRKKRKQLPADAPAVIYCAVPEEWLGRGVNWDEVLKRIAGEFLRGTRRVNAIVFWAEEHITFDHGMPGGALVLIRKPYLNENPRYPLDLNFLFGGTRTEPAREALATGIGLDQLENDSYDSEFFRWIDDLVPAE